MSALFTFEQVKKDLANTCIPFVCIIVITLLTASCSTVPNKQTTNETKAEMLQNIECRTVEVIGSRFKRKVCEHKDTWAAIDKENRKNSDELVRGLNEQSARSTTEGVDGSGGRINTPITPGF